MRAGKTAALSKRVDSQGKHLECVAAKMLKMKQMLRSGSAPVFQMTPRADPRGADPLTTNDAWARSRAAAPTSAPTPQPSASAAWTNWQGGGTGHPTTPSNPYSLAARTGVRFTLIFGGFEANTDKADIEETLRGIVEGAAGVEIISALGKFAAVGRVA